MVVDAMGYSLVYPDGAEGGVTESMPFLGGLVATGEAKAGSRRGRALRVEANAPTVTMPCLKALTSGSLPAFNDANANLGAGSFAEADSVVSQLGRDGRVMVYHGDETWGRMFPGDDLFHARSDGTTAFFVTDTVVVDANVSRHVEEEVGCDAAGPWRGPRDAWALLVLHFLGLDHVGHVQGARGGMMRDKLREMDDVVRRCVEGLRGCVHEEGMGRTLLAVLSDHGMTPQGNHGGTSRDERGTFFAAIPVMRNDENDDDHECEGKGGGLPTVVELLLDPGAGLPSQNRVDAAEVVAWGREAASLTQDKGDANQVDVAASLSLVLGYPPPKNNVGVLLPELLPTRRRHQWRGLDAARVLHANAKQLCDLLGEAAGAGAKAEADVVEALTAFERGAAILREAGGACWAVGEGGERQQQHEEEEEEACGELLRASALALRVAALKAQRWMLGHGAQYDVPALAAGVALLVAGAVCLGWAVARQLQLRDGASGTGDLVLVGACIAQALTLGSSDFVEEEHLVLFFMCYCVVLLATRQVLSAPTAPAASPWPSLRVLWWTAVGVRSLRAFHAMGDKFKHAPSVSTWLAGDGASWQPAIEASAHAAVLFVGRRLLAGSTSAAALVAVGALSACVAGYRLGLLGPALVGDVHVARAAFLLAGVCVAAVLARARRVGGLRGLEAAGTALVVIHAHVQLLIQRAANAPVVALLLLICAGARSFLLGEAVRGRFGAAACGLALRVLGLAAFHGTGNSNSLATVDISGSFTGLTEYSYAACGALTFLATFGGPLMVQWLSLSTVAAVAAPEPRTSSSTTPPSISERDQAWATLAAMWTPVLFVHALALSYYSLVCVHLRHHLFVWSVFAPKLLYLVMTTAELGASLATHAAVTALVAGAGARSAAPRPKPEPKPKPEPELEPEPKPRPKPKRL